MSEAGMQDDSISQKAATHLDYTISYAEGSATSPTWICNGARGKSPRAQGGAKVTLNFLDTGDIAATLTQVVVMVGTKGPCSQASPFHRKSPIILDLNDLTLHIDKDAEGTWGFCVAFSTTTADGNVTSFYYLPDPELAVGPGPGSDDPA